MRCWSNFSLVSRPSCSRCVQCRRFRGRVDLAAREYAALVHHGRSASCRSLLPDARHSPCFPAPEQPMPARKNKNDDEQILRAVAVSIYINDWLRRVNDTRRPFLHSRSRPCRVVTANANTAGEDAQHQMTSERDCFSPVEYWRPWLGGSLARGNSHINGHPQPAAGTGRHCVPLAFI